MPDDASLNRILDRLLQRTQSGGQDWEPSDYGRHPSFVTEVGTWPVVVFSVDGDERHPYRLAILNADEEEIEALQTLDVQTVRSTTERNSRAERNKALSQMFQAAKRNALGVDRALSEIEEILED